MKRIVGSLMIFVMILSIYTYICEFTGLGAMTVEAATGHYESAIPDGSRILLTEDVDSIDYIAPDAAASDPVGEGEHIALDKPLEKGLNNVSFTTQDDNTYSCNFYYKGKAGTVDFKEAVDPSYADRVMVATTTTAYEDGTVLEKFCATYTSGAEDGEIYDFGWQRSIPRKDGGLLVYANDFDKDRESKILYNKDGSEYGYFYIDSDLYDYYSIKWGNKKLSGEWSLTSPSVDIRGDDGTVFCIYRNKNGVVFAQYAGEDQDYDVNTLWIPDTVLFPTFTVTGKGDERKIDFTTKNVKVTCINSFQKIDQSLKKVVVGKNVTNINSKAFYECKKLKTIVINSTKIKKIGKYAFKGINKNATIKLTGTKTQKARIKKLIIQSGIAKTVKIR